jgi:tetratricopeptide (TPR) repeat protein
MRFVEQSMAATDLLNAGQAAQALPILQELTRQYADQDEDGYVAVSLGDCLAMLNRTYEARQAYQAAAAAHADKKSDIEQRLIELDLAGPVSDELIERLRRAAGAGGDGRFLAAWDLGRALQKKAQSLLEEAATAFSRACDPPSQMPQRICRSEHLAALKDLTVQVGSLIGQLEQRWQRFRHQPGAAAYEPSEAEHAQNTQPPARTTAIQWTIQKEDGQRITCELRPGKTGDSPTLLVNGQTAQLSPQQAALISTNQERIQAILSEAIGTGGSPERR